MSPETGIVGWVLSPQAGVFAAGPAGSRSWSRESGYVVRSGVPGVLSTTVNASPIPTNSGKLESVIVPPTEAVLPVTCRQVTCPRKLNGRDSQKNVPVGFSPSGPLLASKSKSNSPGMEHCPDVGGPAGTQYARSSADVGAVRVPPLAA